MKYLLYVLWTLAVLGAFVFLVMNGHPWFALLSVLFVPTSGKDGQ